LQKRAKGLGEQVNEGTVLRIGDDFSN